MAKNRLTLHNGIKEVTIDLPDDFNSIYIYDRCVKEQVAIYRLNESKYRVARHHKSIETKEGVECK